jgi:putative AlgH/UPF0301 family transcriptional regulator
MLRKTSSPEAESRRSHHLDAQLSFCRKALALGYASASQGQLDSACRLLWLVEDAACCMKPILTNLQSAERIDQYQAQIGLVLKDLSELRQILCIPAGLD